MRLLGLGGRLSSLEGTPHPSSRARGAARKPTKTGVHGALGRPKGRKGVGGGWRVGAGGTMATRLRPLAPFFGRSAAPQSAPRFVGILGRLPAPAAAGKYAQERWRVGAQSAPWRGPRRGPRWPALRAPQMRGGHGTRPRREGADQGGWGGGRACLPASRRVPGRLRGAWRDGTDPGHRQR